MSDPARFPFFRLPPGSAGLARPSGWCARPGLHGQSEFYGATDTAEAGATLERALALSINLFDTADMYGLGANESFLGPFIRAHRDRVAIATKFGYMRTPQQPDDWSLNNRPEYIRAAVDRSLQRLGIDVIDLYYMHRRTPDVPLQESIGAMADLVAAGKVRALGLCEVSAEELRLAHAMAWLYEKARQMGVALVPIPGTRRRARLQENVAATAIRLDPQEMAAIEPLADAVQGVAV